MHQALLPPPADGDPLPALDSFEGSLVGIAVGDMVGLGVENFDRATCREYTAKLRPEGGLTATQMPWETRVKADPLIKTRGGKLRGSYPFGQISDDTQCSRELAQSIVDAGRFSIEAFKEQLVHLHETLGVIGQGPTSEATLDALAAGASWFDGSGGEKADALTNGSISKIVMLSRFACCPSR